MKFAFGGWIPSPHQNKSKTDSTDLKLLFIIYYKSVFFRIRQ